MKEATGYSRTQIALHWISALLVIAVFVTHEAMIAAAKAVDDGAWAGYDAPMLIHVAGGVTVFVFALWRLGLLSRRGAPSLPSEEPLPLRLGAVAVKLALYVIVLVMPVSGVLSWFGGVGAAGQVHAAMEPAILAAVALHVLGALYQQLWLKSAVFMRMLSPEPARKGLSERGG